MHIRSIGKCKHKYTFVNFRRISMNEKKVKLKRNVQFNNIYKIYTYYLGMKTKKHIRKFHIIKYIIDKSI